MRIHVLSDLHIEFGKFRHTPPECDVVVLAGDIGVGKQAFPWIEHTFVARGLPVVYVAGNHEFYHRALPEHVEAMRERAAALPHVHFLQNDAVVIQGVRFIGATMWTDFNLFGRQPLDMLTAAQEMNDYDAIAMGGGPTWKRKMLTPEIVLEQHMMSRQFIVDELAKPHAGPTVVVTHHAPSELSIHERHERDTINACYASRLENIMLDFNPALWVHGHVHDSLDYTIGDTRVVCHPRGYVGEHVNENFDPNFVVTL